MAAHRYWRWVFTASDSGNYAQIGEAELMVAAGGSDQTGSGTASADSAYDASHAASKAFANDGYAYANAWESGSGSYPHWLKYDFGAGNGKDILEYALNASDNYLAEMPTSWDFQYSDDNTSWTTVDSRAGYAWVLGLYRRFTVGASATVPFRRIGSLLRSDVMFGGAHRIPVTTKRQGVPCKKRVLLIDRLTGNPVRELWTGSDGLSSFDWIKDIEEGYLVIELDDLSYDPWKDPACADRVTPEAMPG
jgi:hypothetical protein